MKAKIDQEKCIGCGSCQAVCEELFEMDGNKACFKNKKKEQEVEQDKKSCLEQAIDVCPVAAIKVEE